MTEEAGLMSDQELSFALLKHRRAAARIDMLERAARADVVAIRRALEDDTRQLRVEVDYYERRIVEHAKAYKEATGKKSLTWGSSVLKSTTSTVIQYDDENDAAKWLVDRNHALVHIKITIDKNAVKNVAQIGTDDAVFVDGELLPGAKQVTSTSWRINHSKAPDPDLSEDDE